MSVCAACNKAASKSCARCGGVSYCSEACQRSHWGQHKEVCVEPLPTQPTELLPYTLVYYVVDQLQQLRLANKVPAQTVELSMWVIEFMETQFGPPVTGQWTRPRRPPALRELPPKASWPTDMAPALQEALTAEHRERVKDALLRTEYRELVDKGTNVSRTSPMADLTRIMAVEADCLRRERARTAALEALWPAHADSPWLPLDSPLTQEKDAAPDNFECDACLRYSERVVLASHLKDARRPAEALPYAIEGLALLEPWGQQFELALPDRTPHYPAQFWDDERENLLQCVVINRALACQILGQLLRLEEAEQHGQQAVEYALLMEGSARWERLHGAYYSLATLPCACWEDKIKGLVADERLLAFTGASGYFERAHGALAQDPQRAPADGALLRTARMWADALAAIDGDFVAAEQVARNAMQTAMDGEAGVDMDPSRGDAWLLAVGAVTQVASLCWRSAHAYAVYNLYKDPEEASDAQPPVVEPAEAEELVRWALRQLQGPYERDSDPVARPVLEALCTLRRVLVLKRDGEARQAGLYDGDGDDAMDVDESERALATAVVEALTAEIDELRGQILGVAEVYAPADADDWLRDLEGVVAAGADDGEGPETDGDPNSTWMSHQSTR